MNFSFMQPPSRATLSELVRKKNGIPLPLLQVGCCRELAQHGGQAKTGVRLPPSKYCLTAPNFQLLPKDRPPNTAKGHAVPASGGGAPTCALAERELQVCRSPCLIQSTEPPATR